MKQVASPEVAPWKFCLPTSFKARCCYSCGFYFGVGQAQGAAFWFDAGDIKNNTLWTTFLICSQCGCQHCLIHSPHNLMDDNLYYCRTGPRVIALTPEEIEQREQWILERELRRIRYEDSELKKGKGYWINHDIAYDGQPPRINLLPGKSRPTQIWRAFDYAVRDYRNLALFAIVSILWDMLALVGKTWRIFRPKNESPDEVAEYAEARNRRLAKAREEEAERKQFERELWPMQLKNVMPLRLFLGPVDSIPTTNSSERALVLREQLEHYKTEVISSLSCGYCGQISNLCFEWKTQDCPLCGKANLDFAHLRYSIDRTNRTA